MPSETAAPADAHADARRGARAAAERHLRALVGRDDAELREDQWTAIEALVVDAPPGAGRAAHRLGQVSGLLRRHRCCCATQGAGPTLIVSPLLALMRNQIGAAERAGHPRGHDQLHQHRGLGRHRATQLAAGEVDLLLISPERLNNPDFRDEVLPRLAASARPAGRRRGALHLRLGPRLPARLPPASARMLADLPDGHRRCSPPPRPPTSA